MYAVFIATWTYEIEDILGVDCGTIVGVGDATYCWGAGGSIEVEVWETETYNDIGGNRGGIVSAGTWVDEGDCGGFCCAWGV